MAFKVIISREYKDHASGKYRVKRVRLGSFFFGEIREYKTKIGDKKLRIYWSARLNGEQNAAGKMWAFDKAVMGKMSQEGACLSHIGVMLTSDVKRKISDPKLVSEMWLVSMTDFKTFNINGALGHSYFVKVANEVTDEDKIKSMKIGRK